MLGQGGSWVNAASGALGGKYVRTTRFITIGSGTSGTVTLPPGATVVLDDFGGTTDALVSVMSGGKPTFNTPLTALGAPVATSFDSSGNYNFTGVPASYPVALIYRVEQTLQNFDSTSSDIIGTPNFISPNSYWGSIQGNIDNQSDLINKTIVNALIFG
jgi:hypothetical protein